MNPEHLQLFVRVAQTHNISQAGEALGLSPAVASAYLGKLEKELGVRLVHRTTRNASLSEDGKAFLPYAEEVLTSIELAKNAVGVGNAALMGSLRITASASFGRQHLIPALSKFMDQHPAIHVDLHLSDTIMDLAEGGFDLAIRIAELKDSNLVARKLADDRRIICASPTYLAQHGTPVSIEELKQHHIVALRPMEVWSFKQNGRTVSVKPRTRLRVDNGEAMRDACCLGMGLTINSIWNTYQQLARGELVEVLQDFPLADDAGIWAVYPSSRQVPAKVRALIDFLLQWFGETPYWETALATAKGTTIPHP